PGNLPNTIPLNRAPSKEWAESFEGFNWQIVGLSEAQFPKIVKWGIGIPEMPTGMLKTLLLYIDKAIEQINAAEAKRVEGLPPDTATVYEEWFAGRGS